MFTGLVETTGTVRSLARSAEGGQLELTIPFADELALGESVAVNGCCLTVAERVRGGARFDLLAQTLRVTGLGDLAQNDTVNLERALRADARLGGHFVQGHVDTVTQIAALEAVGDDYRFEVVMPTKFARYLIPKGSIAVDGISLTAAEVDDTAGTFTCWITPHTYAATNLAKRRKGARVNLELDLLAKHLERLLAFTSPADDRGLNKNRK